MWDIFISHANEDKDAVARPLAERLRSLGLTVWYDEFTLLWVTAFGSLLIMGSPIQNSGS